jgi:hypothetical protein
MILRQRRGIVGIRDTILPLNRARDFTSSTRRKPQRIQPRNLLMTSFVFALLLVLLLVSVSWKAVDEGSRKRVVQCADGSFGVIDDDYCDCPDGIDEMNTAACSNILVQNKTFRCQDGVLIFTSRVKDGVSDCTDKSDEL